VDELGGMSDLSQAEREAMNMALRNVPRSRGSAPGFEDGWLAARDYYRNRDLEDIVEDAVERLREIEGVERALREALTRIDSEVPSEEHWHRMGDSMWANIGRLAAKIAHAALAASPQSSHGPGEASEDGHRLSLRPFPMQEGPPIPWFLAELIHRHLYRYEQSVERIAERGGFGWEEVQALWRKNSNADQRRACVEGVRAALGVQEERDV
jgi:hypothetical protein